MREYTGEGEGVRGMREARPEGSHGEGQRDPTGKVRGMRWEVVASAPRRAAIVENGRGRKRAVGRWQGCAVGGWRTTGGGCLASCEGVRYCDKFCAEGSVYLCTK